MLWSFWRGVNSLVEQARASDKIENNNIINTMLPAEMLQRIFRFLPPQDLKAAVTVCRWWRDIGSQGALWTWVKLCAHKDNLGSMSEILKSARFAQIRKITVRASLSNDLLHEVGSHPGLRIVSFGHVDLTGLDVGLMAKVFSELEVVQLQRAQITWDQLSAILAAIVQCGAGADTRLEYHRQPRLKSLNISGTDVSKVDPKLLAGAVVKLKEITLTYTCLTKEQAKDIMLALSVNSNLTLKKLNIGKNDLSGVDPDLLSIGLAKVARVSLADTSLTNDQFVSLLMRASNSSSSSSSIGNSSSSSLMARLNLSTNNLSQVPPTLLAGPLLRVEIQYWWR